MAWKPASPEAGDAVAELQLLAVLVAKRQLEELARMRAVGMGWVERLMAVLEGRIDPTIDPVFRRSKGFVPDFVKITRAVRQVIVLQQELAGLRAARRRKLEDRGEPGRSHGKRGPKRLVWRPLGPLPGDTKDFYDFRPVGEAAEWIRETLGVEAPADDPFREPEAVAADPEPAPAGDPPVKQMLRKSKRPSPKPVCKRRRQRSGVPAC